MKDKLDEFEDQIELETDQIALFDKEELQSIRDCIYSDKFVVLKNEFIRYQNKDGYRNNYAKIYKKLVLIAQTLIKNEK